MKIRSIKLAAAVTAALVAPLALSAPAFADGGVGIGNRESNNSAYRNRVNAMRDHRTMRRANDTLDRLLAWHEVMLDANALDHTPTSGVAGDQQGPTRNSRAFAIISVAVFDAVNAFDRRFQPYSSGIPAPANNASRDAAIAQAAYTAIRALYPRQATRLDQLFSSDLSSIRGSAASITAGRLVGTNAAMAILNARAADGGGAPGTGEVNFGTGGAVAGGGNNVFGEPVNGGQTAAPRWTPDPTPTLDGVTASIRPIALGASWGAVTPFNLNSGNQFRIPNYPAPNSARFRAAYEDVRLAGSDPTVVPGSTNNAAKQFIGNFWGYDGAPLLGTPPRLYNQIAVTVANREGLRSVSEYARLLALVNTTMGDSGIAAWDSKYFHNLWRPVTGIPGAASDGDPTTAADPAWRPFGASVINLDIPERFTPPFPAYPSGHATFGAAMAQSLTSYFGNNTRFTFISDEYNGAGIDPKLPAGNQVRPLVPVRYRTLLEAQQENGRSRVFNGVHWEPDDTEGQTLGTKIVRFTLANAFQRRGGGGHHDDD